MTNNTFHTAATKETFQHTMDRHWEEIQKVNQEVLGLLDIKGQDYDGLRSFIERMPFGDKSWATLLFIKADRLCSTLLPDEPSDDKVDDCLIDLLVYATAYRAWRNIQKADTREREEALEREKQERFSRHSDGIADDGADTSVGVSNTVYIAPRTTLGTVNLTELERQGIGIGRMRAAGISDVQRTVVIEGEEGIIATHTIPPAPFGESHSYRADPFEGRTAGEAAARSLVDRDGAAVRRNYPGHPSSWGK